MKKRLNLKKLKVQSFIVELNTERKWTAKGGSWAYTCMDIMCPELPQPEEPPTSGTPACTAPKSWWQNCVQG
ncbi:MAG: pinensin family lanthipeptide [Bacteroidota bacterium]